jgi:hypothetical protein
MEAELRDDRTTIAWDGQGANDPFWFENKTGLIPRPASRCSVACPVQDTAKVLCEYESGQGSRKGFYGQATMAGPLIRI